MTDDERAAARHIRIRWPVVLAMLVVAIAAWFGVRRLVSSRVAPVAVTTESVSRHDITQSVDASGTVQAVEVVEIKSKASGQIVRMPITVGSVVRAGDLLAQIDPLTVRNQYEQALAAKHAADAAVQVSGAQQKRADELFARGAITAVDRDAAALAAANALASQARAASDLQIARQSLDDATVRAPSAGTVLEQTVTPGMVITSATSSPSGGTTLLRMADLNRLEMRALVGETDIGALELGMSAQVTVDAFPNLTFKGRVIKIEPQAVVEQSVTMFPVRVAIENENGRLLPGMNGEVTIEIANRSAALSVPLDALRTPREAPAVAAVLGLDADSLRAGVQRQSEALLAARRNGSAAPGAPRPNGVSGGGRDAARFTRAAATDERPGVARVSEVRRGARGAAAASTTAAGARGAQARGNGTNTNRSNLRLVVVQTARGLEPRVIRIGISDFDRAEVLSGLAEGEQVVLLGVAEQVAKRRDQQAQLARRMGNGMPGSAGTGGAGRTGASNAPRTGGNGGR